MPPVPAVDIALGTFKIRGADASRAVAHALRKGYRHIDTAAVYRNEVDVGKAVTSALEDGTLGSRAEVKITTKLTPKAHTSAAAAQAELRACIERLGLGTPIDTVLVHWPGTGGKPREDEGNAARRLVTWRVLLEAQARGDVVQLGASNYTVAHLAEMEAAGLPLPAVNQVELHPRLPQEALRKWCADRGVVVQAYSPLGCGDLLAAPAITGMAGKHKTPPATILIRWLVEQGLPMAIKSATPERIAANLDAATHSSSMLDAEDWEQLKKMNDGHHYCWDPTFVA